MTTCTERITLGLGEMRVVRNQSVILSCVGLGSCVAICAYDPVSRIAGMAHITLPVSRGNVDALSAAKYVDTGVPYLIGEMVKQGAVKRRLSVKMVGGAQMLSIPGSTDRMNIGEKNVEAARKALQEMGLALVAHEVGGNMGRTVQMYTDSGRIHVRTVGCEGRFL